MDWVIAIKKNQPATGPRNRWNLRVQHFFFQNWVKIQVKSIPFRVQSVCGPPSAALKGSTILVLCVCLFRNSASMRKVKLMPWTNGGAASAPAPPVVRSQSTVKKCVEYRWTVDDFPTTAKGDQPLKSPLLPADDRPQWHRHRVGFTQFFVSH